jgi:hypothetical protein
MEDAWHHQHANRQSANQKQSRVSQLGKPNCNSECLAQVGSRNRGEYHRQHNQPQHIIYYRRAKDDAALNGG